MKPGPTIIKKCISCSKPIEQPTITSGNTIGAILWTDAKREAPMLPDQPWLVICPHCQTPLWIDELETLAAIKIWGKYENSERYNMPSINDYVLILDKGVETTEKEKYIRERLWWAGNNARRTETPEIEMSDIELLNLKIFADMLDESDDNELIKKAEIMRETGRFNDAKALLAKVTNSDADQAVEFIRALANKGDCYVRKMYFL